jgi:hypothetical protein
VIEKKPSIINAGKIIFKNNFLLFESKQTENTKVYLPLNHVQIICDLKLIIYIEQKKLIVKLMNYLV